MGSALTKLEKASMILNLWTEEYGFDENPDPVEAIAWANSKPGGQSLESKQSAKWFCEYGRIYKFIDIVFDYVSESKKELEKALEQKGLK